MHNDLFQQLSEIKKAWDGLTIAEDFSGWGFPGLTKQLVSDSLGGLVKITEEFSKIENFDNDPVAISFVQAVLITNLRAYVTQHVPSNPQPHIAGLLEQIERIRIFLWRWQESPKAKNQITVNFTSQLSEAVSRMTDASVIFETIQNNKDIADSSASQSIADAEQIKQLREKIEALHLEMEQFNEQTKVLFEQARNNSNQILDSVSTFRDLGSELSTNKENQQKLFDEFEANRDQVNRLLEDTNRATMAASFLTRKNELQKPIHLWIFIFIISILALTITGLYFIQPSIDSKEWYTVLTKLPLTIPIVWLGWFSARQFGFTSRLQEDYAYKVASAMAFEGYKREATETDPELKKKLLDTAINHLAENPLRIFNGDHNHGSPLHELFGQLSKDKKFIELIKEYFSKLISTKS